MPKTRINPSQREKKRYITLKITTQKDLPPKWGMHFLHAIEDNLGVFNTMKAGLKLVDTTKNGYGILRVSHNNVETVLATLATLRKIKNTKIKAIQTFKTTGIIRKARSNLKAKKTQTTETKQ